MPSSKNWIPSVYENTHPDYKSIFPFLLKISNIITVPHFLYPFISFWYWLVKYHLLLSFLNVYIQMGEHIFVPLNFSSFLKFIYIYVCGLCGYDLFIHVMLNLYWNILVVIMAIIWNYREIHIVHLAVQKLISHIQLIKNNKNCISIFLLHKFLLTLIVISNLQYSSIKPRILKIIISNVYFP